MLWCNHFNTPNNLGTSSAVFELRRMVDQGQWNQQLTGFLCFTEKEN
jgi:hypothetical protein